MAPTDSAKQLNAHQQADRLDGYDGTGSAPVINSIEAEEERIRQRYALLGSAEIGRRQALRDEAQELCYRLCWSARRGDPRIERALNHAEDRRERRHQWCWG